MQRPAELDQTGIFVSCSLIEFCISSCSVILEYKAVFVSNPVVRFLLSVIILLSVQYLFTRNQAENTARSLHISTGFTLSSVCTVLQYI